MTGTVFDIKEFAIYDGPGIRTTVFMKGCPLHCEWCHNPEGLSVKPQLMVSAASCKHCGACREVCPNNGECTACGKCVAYCPLGLRRIAGKEWTAEELADRLMKDAPLLNAAGGGITFSGGEPLLQWQFVKEVLARLPGMHTAIETSGYAEKTIFAEAMQSLSLIMMDVKFTDPIKHKQYTGVDNAVILENAQRLCEGETPFIIRIPVIPGVNDDGSHFENVAELLKGAKKLIRVELLPYHRTAGAKYSMVNKVYKVSFDEAEKPNMDTSAFDKNGIPVLLMKQA